jgi:hypothetical protein
MRPGRTAMKRGALGERHIRIYASLYETPAFRTLPPSALKLWIDLRRAFNGCNNGNISCTLTSLRRYDWRSSDTLNRALWELLSRGLIRRTREGKPGPFRLCALYAFTDLPTAKNERLEIVGSPPTKEFASWVSGTSFAPITKAAKLPVNSARKKLLLQKPEGYRSTIQKHTALQTGELGVSAASNTEPASLPPNQPEPAPGVDSSVIASSGH